MVSQLKARTALGQNYINFAPKIIHKYGKTRVESNSVKMEMRLKVEVSSESEESRFELGLEYLDGGASGCSDGDSRVVELRTPLALLIALIDLET